MITAVDTSVLLDVFGADRTFGPTSRSALSDCLATGNVLACEVVWVEVAGFFSSPRAAEEAMDTLGVGYSAMQRGAALAAARAWRISRQQDGSRDLKILEPSVGPGAG